MSELLLDEDIKEGDGKWPVEVVVAVETDGTVIVLNRDSYNELLSVKPEPITESMDIGLPGLLTRVCAPRSSTISSNFTFSFEEKKS